MLPYTTIMLKHCLICRSPGHELCSEHDLLYMWDSSIKGYRLKKKNAGSRYTQVSYHKSEIKLTKILEHFYGPDQVFTSYHPKWAESEKGVLYEYDILIKPINLLIEYHGIQHFEYPNFFHRNKEQFKQQQKRDKKKIRLAKRNGYKLLIIKHSDPLVDDFILKKIEDFISDK